MARVRAKMAGRTGRGEPGISLILAEDETSLETHGPQQIHLPPKMTQKIVRVRVLSISEPPQFLSSEYILLKLKVEVGHCTAFVLCKTLFNQGKNDTAMTPGTKHKDVQYSTSFQKKLAGKQAVILFILYY